MRDVTLLACRRPRHVMQVVIQSALVSRAAGSGRGASESGHLNSRRPCQGCRSCCCCIARCSSLARDGGQNSDVGCGDPGAARQRARPDSAPERAQAAGQLGSWAAATVTHHSFGRTLAPCLTRRRSSPGLICTPRCRSRHRHHRIWRRRRVAVRHRGMSSVAVGFKFEGLGPKSNSYN